MMDIENFYSSVINDVIEGMKETFTQEGCDLDVLEQLRNLWSSKLAETHVTDPEPLSQPIIQFAQRIQPSQFPGVFRQQAVIGQQSMGINITRLPIQPNVGGIHTLQPIGRPNAPLTTLSMGTGGPPTGLVLRSSLSEPMSGAPRPIMLAAALNPQNAQQRIVNPNGQFTGITIRAQTSNTAQPGQATIIGQPMNGVIQGQNVQFVQLGQQALMLPLQLRQSAPAQQGTTSTATTTTTATILPGPPPPHHHHQQTIHQQQTQQMHIQMQPQNQHQQHFQQQQIQQIQIQQQRMQQQQNFNRTQVDGAGDGDSDFSDEDADVLEPYSVETPLRTGPLSVAPASTPRLGGGGGGGSSVRSKQPSFNYLQQPPSSALGVLEDDDDTDDEGMVAATPGTFAPPTGISSSFTPNPTPIPATPTPKRPTSPPSQVGAVVGKRSREEDTLGEGDVDVDSEEGEGDFGSVANMTPVAHRTATLATPGTATPTTTTTSRRKQKVPKGNQQQNVSDHANIPDLLPPEKPKTVSEKKEQESVADGTAASRDGNGGNRKDSKGPPKEQNDDDEEEEEEEEEEDEPLNSGDDVSDEDAEELFQSENLVVCQYDRVSRCRSKWRFWLHDGVMKIRGRDRLFHKMVVETDWLVDTSFRP
ncbi:unnamed protein product [Rodentolepis nana]|uniref:Transcription initiation factor IIA subunit 1 n=1 Tax=Rodentolepis nana TaxID=102285 RepID=A0A0R3TTL4_RODNA|nr:unnamed protein product [Rodentolepis nana]